MQLLRVRQHQAPHLAVLKPPVQLVLVGGSAGGRFRRCGPTGRRVAWAGWTNTSCIPIHLEGFRVFWIEARNCICINRCCPATHLDTSRAVMPKAVADVVQDGAVADHGDAALRAPEGGRNDSRARIMTAAVGCYP